MIVNGSTYPGIPGISWKSLNLSVDALSEADLLSRSSGERIAFTLEKSFIAASYLDQTKALQLLFHFADGVGIEQLAQVGIAQQIAQLLLVDGKGLGTALGQRRIAIVDVIGHIAEEQRRGKRRRR